MTGSRVPRRVKHFPRTDGPCPPGVKWVGRNGRNLGFGNPHPVGKPCPVGDCAGVIHDRADACRLHEADYHAGRLPYGEPDILGLARFDALACACPEDGEPCHADLYIGVIREQGGQR